MIKKKKQIVPTQSVSDSDIKAPIGVICKKEWVEAKKTMARVGLPKELEELMKKGK